MEAKYILVASGGITTHQINIMIFEDTEDRAVEESAKIVKDLSAAGCYYRFDLYDVGAELHRTVASFNFKIETSVNVKRMGGQ